MSVGDTYRMAIKWEQVVTLDDAVNVFHFRQMDAEVMDNPMEDLLNAYVGQAEVNYLACVSAAYRIGLYSIRQITGGEAEFEASGELVGTNGTSETAMPSTVAGIISWKSGIPGRSKRGRTFLPPATEGALSYGQWTPGQINLMNSCALGFLNMGTHASSSYAHWEIGVYSPLGGGFTPYTTYVARPTPGTIRRRRIGSGS